MKKIFTLMFVALVSISASASESVKGASTWNPWAESVTLTDEGEYVNMVFTEAWSGAGFWVAGPDEDVYEPADWSDYEYLVYEVADVNGSFNICVQYLQDCSVSSSGSIGTNGYGYIRLDDDYSDRVTQTWIQATGASSIKVTDLILMTEEELQAYKESKKPQGDKISIFQGEQVFGSSWPAISLGAALFEDVEVGNQLVVTVSEVDQAINPDWEWGSQIFINSGNWYNIDGLKAEGITEPGDYSFTLTAAQVDSLLSSGCNVQGMNVKVTEVYILKTAASSAIWEGEQVFLGDWGQWVQVAAAAFDDAKVGDIIVATISDVDPTQTGWGSQLLWKDSSWGEMVGTSAVNLPEAGDYSLVITEEILAKLKEGGLIIQGVGFTITKLALQEGSSSVSALKAETSTYGKLYNLSGVQVDASYNGIVIMNGKKYLNK